MASFDEDIREFVEAAVKPLINHPDELHVDIAEPSPNLLIEITTDPEDAGKVIGRQGRVIKSIRTIARAAASHVDTNVDVEIVD